MKKMGILLKEAARRLSKINYNNIDKAEVIQVMENFIGELKNSRYDQKESFDIVTSGMIVWRRKRRRRENKIMDSIKVLGAQSGRDLRRNYWKDKTGIERGRG